MNFKEKLLHKDKPILLDGAMGTMLQKYGLIAGEYPEKFNFTHEETIFNIHKAYLDAGAEIILTNTFGANALKTQEIGYSVQEILIKAISIAKRAINDLISPNKSSEKYIALDIGAIGQLMEPLGTISFDKAYTIFKEIISIGFEAGVDLIYFETMSDIYELRAGILAAKENCDLPIMCTMTFQENGRTLTGTDPETMVYILEGLGVDAVGINCSLEPKKMRPLIERILTVASIPVIVKPNAGLPQYDSESIANEITADGFATELAEIAKLGAMFVGGCCGTNPEYISALHEKLKRVRIKHVPNQPPISVACSATKSVIFGQEIKIIGERINPTGRKVIKAALKENNLTVLVNEAVQQREVGADILDINVGLPEINESKVLISLIKEIQTIIDTPLQIDSSNYEAIENAVRIYNGKPIINSVNGTDESMTNIFPIMKKYGTMAIALTLDERGLPTSVEDRIEIADKIIRTANSYGLSKEAFLFDCLVLTASVHQKEVMNTLNAVQILKQKYGVNTTLGISNISFGLPNRPLLNTTFLAMALAKGVDAPICDPLAETNRNIIDSFKVIANQDLDANEYIKKYSQKIEGSDLISPASKESDLNEIVLKGLKNEITPKIRALLSQMTPKEILDNYLIPSLELVGNKYENNEIFLPQLIRSAETVKSGLEIIKKEIVEQNDSNLSQESHKERGKIILATVKGDIHDLGKNIVKILLENYDFKVIDLGKDVSIESIVKAVKESGAQLVGLSALMTTTVENMKKTIDTLHQQNLECKIMVGGAVLNEFYAEMIHADFYGKSAWDAVNIAKEIYRD